MVVAKSEEDLLADIPQTVSNQTRYDDGVTAGEVAELATFLSGDIDNQKKYQRMQNSARNQSELYTKRKRELALLYLFQSNTIKGKTNEFWSNEYANRVFSDSALNRGEGEDGEIVAYDEFSQGMGKNTGVDNEYIDNDTKRKLRQVKRQDGKKDSLYLVQSQSIGATGSPVTINFSKVKPAGGSSTDNLMERLIDALSDDRSAMIVLMAILVKWRIELDTFIPASKVPKEWYLVSKFIESADEDAVGNLRKVVSEFGVKNLRSTSPEMKAIQDALLSVTDVKDSKELAEMFAREAINEDKNLEVLESIFEASPTMVKKVKPTARMVKLLNRLDKGLQKGSLTMTSAEWTLLLPTLVNDNAERKTAAYSRAFAFAKKRIPKIKYPQDVVTTLGIMFSEKPKDPKLGQVVADLAMSPINESMAVKDFLEMIAEAANSDDGLMPLRNHVEK